MKHERGTAVKKFIIPQILVTLGRNELIQANHLVVVTSKDRVNVQNIMPPVLTAFAAFVIYVRPQWSRAKMAEYCCHNSHNEGQRHRDSAKQKFLETCTTW